MVLCQQGCYADWVQYRIVLNKRPCLNMPQHFLMEYFPQNCRQIEQKWLKTLNNVLLDTLNSWVSVNMQGAFVRHCTVFNFSILKRNYVSNSKSKFSMNDLASSGHANPAQTKSVIRGVVFSNFTVFTVIEKLVFSNVSVIALQ